MKITLLLYAFIVGGVGEHLGEEVELIAAATTTTTTTTTVVEEACGVAG